jgi:parvulin-like peptidyl-prolyl isomerase
MRRALPILLVVLLLSGCARHIAEVDGQKVSLKRYRRLLKERLRQHPEEPPQAARQAVLEALIQRALLLKGAREKGLEVKPEELQAKLRQLRQDKGDLQAWLRQQGLTEEELKEELREEILIDKFRHSFAGIQDVSLEEVRRAYRRAPPVKEPLKVKLTMVELLEADKARALAEQMRRGGLSLQGLSQQDGIAVLGPRWTEPGLFSPEVAQVLEEASEGEVVGPLALKGSYYVLLVHERRPPQYASFQEAKERVMFSLLQRLRHQRMTSWLQQRRAQAVVKVREKLL